MYMYWFSSRADEGPVGIYRCDGIETEDKTIPMCCWIPRVGSELLGIWRGRLVSTAARLTIESLLCR